MTLIVFLLFPALLGYVIGRFGHCYLNIWIRNPGWIPHHWITAIVIMIAGLVFVESMDLSRQTISFGAGLFISDLKDFVKMQIISPDEEGEKVFWHID